MSTTAGVSGRKSSPTSSQRCVVVPPEGTVCQEEAREGGHPLDPGPEHGRQSGRIDAVALIYVTGCAPQSPGDTWAPVLQEPQPCPSQAQKAMGEHYTTSSRKTRVAHRRASPWHLDWRRARRERFRDVPLPFVQLHSPALDRGFRGHGIRDTTQHQALKTCQAGSPPQSGRSRVPGRRDRSLRVPAPRPALCRTRCRPRQPTPQPHRQSVCQPLHCPQECCPVKCQLPRRSMVAFRLRRAESPLPVGNPSPSQ